MSSLPTSRMPASISLRFSSPSASRAEPALAGPVSTALDRSGQLWRLGLGTADTLYLRFDADDGDRLFVKMVDATAAPSLLASDMFARLVGDAGLSAATLILAQALPVTIPAALRPPCLLKPVLLVYPYIDGRPPQAPDDMELLGDAVGRMHAVMAGGPDGCLSAVRRAGAERLRIIAAAWSELAAADAPPFRSRSWFMPAGPAQMLHGDLNPGNLLVAAGTVTFMDFENTGHSWLPPVTEVAFILERLVLTAVRKDGDALAATAAFLTAYARHRPLPARGTLAPALSWLSLRALAILSVLAKEGRPRPAAETDKFLALLELHAQRHSLVEQLETLLD